MTFARAYPRRRPRFEGGSIQVTATIRSRKKFAQDGASSSSMSPEKGRRLRARPDLSRRMSRETISDDPSATTSFCPRTSTVTRLRRGGAITTPASSPPRVFRSRADIVFAGAGRAGPWLNASPRPAEKVVETGLVDPAKVGIVRRSMSGFNTAFVATIPTSFRGHDRRC